MLVIIYIYYAPPLLRNCPAAAPRERESHGVNSRSRFPSPVSMDVGQLQALQQYLMVDR